MVGNVHAVFTVLTVDGRRDALVRNLRELVAEELEIIDGDPPDALKRHNEALIQQTLVRADVVIKARSGRRSEHPPPPQADQPRQRHRKSRGVRGQSQAGAARRLLIMVNGDTTRSRCQHFENGCCVDASGAPGTREVIVENFVTAVLEAGLLGHRSSRAPARNRWLTCYECLSLISAGMLLHRLLPRVWFRFVPKYEIPHGATDVDGFHKLIRAKIWRAKVWLDHPDACMRSVCTGLTSAPAYHLLMVLQRIDEQGGAILQLTHPQTAQSCSACSRLLGISFSHGMGP